MASSAPLTKLQLYIAGDSLLASEYVAVCASRDCAVRVPPVPGTGRKRQVKTTLPRGIRTALRPPRGTTLAMELTNRDPARKRALLEEWDRALPATVPILTSSVTVTLAEQSVWVEHPERLVGIGAFPTLLSGSLIEFSTLNQTHPNALHAARNLAVQLGKEASVVADTPGMVLPRILCMIINEACFALGEKLATAADIDTAMKLGTNYPHGPIAWAEQIGPEQVYAVMQALHAAFGDRYRPAPLLRQAALTGTFPARANQASHD